MFKEISRFIKNRTKNAVAVLLIVVLILGSMPVGAVADNGLLNDTDYETANENSDGEYYAGDDSAYGDDSAGVDYGYNDGDYDYNDNGYGDDYGYNDNDEYDYNYENEYEYEDEEYEEYELPVLPIEGLVPFNGGFSATIISGAQTVNFGAGSRIELPSAGATTTPQTVRIYEEFPTGQTASAVVMHLNRGLQLGIEVPGFTGTGNNRTFNLAALPSHLEGIVIGGRWIPPDPVVQDRTGNTLQSHSGTLVYLLAAGTTEVEIAPQVSAERIFSQTGSPGRLHSDIIQVKTFADIGLTVADLQSQTFAGFNAHIAGLTAQNETTLEEYFLNGGMAMQIRSTGNPPSRTYSRGDTWRTGMQITAAGGSLDTPPFFEEATIVLHLSKNIGVLGVRSRSADEPGATWRTSQMTDDNIVPINTGFAEPMISFTIDRDSSTTHDIVTITMIQPSSAPLGEDRAFIVYGQIPTTAVPGTYSAVGLQSSQSPVTHVQGGATHNMYTLPFENIRVAEDTINRLAIISISANPHHSPVPTDAALDLLGGFRLFNEFTDELYDQALRLFFDNAAIGVQAFRLPVGPDGFDNLYVRTTSGRTISATDPGVMVSAPFHAGSTNAQQSVNISFLNVLAYGEFIVELYYELAGIIPVGFTYNSQGFMNRFQTNFFYLGQTLDHNVASFSARAIVGEICDDPANPDGIVQNPYGMAASDPARIRDSATNTRVISPAAGIERARIVYGTNAGNLGTPLVAGAPFQRRNVNFNMFHTGNGDLGNHAMPSAVKGHYVYLRAPYGILDIARETLEATWMEQSFTEGNGMTVTEIIDSTGSRAFRLALPDVILGIYNENFASSTANTGQIYSSVSVHFDIRALPAADTQSFLKNQVAMIVPMNPEITPAHVGTSGAATTTRNFTIDDGVNPVRVAPGMWVSGRTASTVTIQESAELTVWTEARSVDATGTVLANSPGYEWATNAGWLNLVPNGGIEQEFHYFNSTDDPVGQFQALIPIPKYDYTMPLNEIPEAGLRSLVQREAFEFSLDLLYEIQTIPGFTITYSPVYTFDMNSPHFVAWGSPTVADSSNIRMVRITSYRNIAPGESGSFLMQLGIATDKNTVEFAGLENRYAPLTFSNVRGSAAQRQASPIAIRMWNYVIFNYNYTNSDGIFLETPVAHGGTVTAPNPAPQRTGYTFDRWTTDAAGTTNYVFTTAVTAPNLNLFAQWTRNAYSITYAFTGTVPTGVTAPAARNNITAGTTGLAASAVTSPVTGTHNGLPGTFTFGGWSAAGIGNPAAFTMPDGGVAFTGNWTFAADEFEVSYNKTGYVPAGAPSTPISRNVAAGTPDVSGTSITPTWVDGYEYGIAGIWTFSGWEAPAPLGATFTMPAANVVFSGTWAFSAGTPNVIYTVTSARPPSYSGMPTSPQVETSGTTVTVEAIPTTSETVNSAGTPGAWTFNGWNHATITGATFTMPNDNVEFTGYWTFTPDTHIVTFTAAAGGTISPGPTHEVTVVSGQHLTTAQVPTPTANAGYRFIGWFLSNAAATPTANPITGNITFQARFELIPGGGNGTDPTPNPAVQITKSAPATVQSNTPLTYTITVRNTGNVTLTGLVVADSLPAQLQYPRNLHYPTSVTAAFTGQTLNATISSLNPGQSVTISFVVTVNAAAGTAITNTATVNVPNMPGVSGESTVTTNVVNEQPEMIKNPDRTVVRVGESINWTLRGFHNRSGVQVSDFAIVDIPSQGLNFQSGSLPAFNNGEGITFDIRYMVAGSDEWRTHATGIDASSPFDFTLPQPGNLHYTSIGFFFGNVPADFGLNSEIVLTFVVGEGAPNNTLVNRFIVQYSNIEREGGSPETPIVVPDDTTSGGEGGGNREFPGITPQQPSTPGQAGETTPQYEHAQPQPTTDTATDAVSTATGRTNPQTGDNVNPMAIALPVAGLVISLGALLVVRKSRRQSAA